DLLFKSALEGLEHALEATILQHALQPFGYSSRQCLTGTRASYVEITREGVEQQQMLFERERGMSGLFSRQFLSNFNHATRKQFKAPGCQHVEKTFVARTFHHIQAGLPQNGDVSPLAPLPNTVALQVIEAADEIQPRLQVAADKEHSIAKQTLVEGKSNG